MIVFKSCKWGNIFSYGESNFLDFTKDRVVQLVGANGNGKSSIAWILEEALYNKNSRGRKRESLLNWNTKATSYYIEVEFSVDSDNYLLKVKRAKTASVILLKNGEDISSHTAMDTYKTIESILGYNFKTICQIVFQTHSSSLEFLSSPDTARKKFLIDLVNLNKYTQIGDVIKKLQSEMNKEVTFIQGKLSTIEDWINKHVNTDFSKKELIPEDTVPLELTDKLDSLKTKIANATYLNRKISDNKAYKQSLDNTPLPNTPIKSRENSSAFLQKKGSLTNAIDLANKRKNKVLSLKDTCPTCSQTISEEFRESLIKAEELIIAESNIELQDIANKIKEIEAINREWDNFEKTQQSIEKLSCLIDNSLPDDIIDKSVLEAEFEEIHYKINQLKEAIEAAKSYNKLSEIHNNKIDLVQEQLNEYSIELDKWKDKQANLTIKLGYISTLVKAFSTTGLVAYKLESITNTLQELVNDYLTILSNGQFQLIFNLADDKLNIVISNNGETSDINSLSAGELTRVNISTLLGIRKLLQKIAGNNINLLFLDESISTLDFQGKEKLVEVLLEEEGVNTIIVSHEYQHPLVSTIQVLKENGISYLQRE